ncbi:DUF2239 family protein [Novosphingobium pokkalii]|uniref:DUF2239 family protein n=1 Tax=Novosphingobium pokkalii TaxID=1770194 RepID=UPI0036408CBF
MSDPTLKTCTAFVGHRLLLSGLLPDVAQAVRQSTGLADVVLVFDDATGRIVDLDLRGSDADILERISQPPRPMRGAIAPKLTRRPTRRDWMKPRARKPEADRNWGSSRAR